jgi:hypothetical protein
MNLQAANSICSGWLMSSKMPEALNLGLPKIQVISFLDNLRKKSLNKTVLQENSFTKMPVLPFLR